MFSLQFNSVISYIIIVYDCCSASYLITTYIPGGRISLREELLLIDEQ